MALRKLNLLPDSASYSVAAGADVLRTKLDGGLGRYRLDILGGSREVDVQWSISGTTYNYLEAFFNSYAQLSSTAFLIDLIISNQAIEEHTAYFVPESFKLTRQTGLLYIVKAQLEVLPITRGEGYNELIVALFEAYGEDYDATASTVFGLLETFVNTQLPTVG